MVYPFKDKVALITGASSGIGLATARALAAQGAQLALTARLDTEYSKLVEEFSGRASIVAADLCEDGMVEKVVDHHLRTFGRIDVLVASAGMFHQGYVPDDDPEIWDRLIGLNVNSVFRTIRRVLPSMVAQQAGDIIALSSVSGHTAIHHEPVYSASKHAIQAFIHGLRRQVGQQNIRVGAVAPGIVLTKLTGYTDEEQIAEKVRLGEGVRAEDVADAITFMLSRPRHVTIRDLVLLPSNQPI
ncbi:SDR family oxidoreductase [Rhizobium grahamii]|uniref:Serine 3-dehydrogenase n=1 Tax=Rhizobium grahamii CCGE 502 TaxID=990285 RepID=S3I2B4_9HYPH|nr:SDR family oxidoreductase [Rhizobium grahamii]EPE93923.1 ribitol 2-dehydrogenase [Rhizobium grahamii CCGE 502]